MSKYSHGVPSIQALRPICATLWSLILVIACADSPRENVFDPVSAPSIEMTGDPVFAEGAVVVEWRFTSDRALQEFRIGRIVEGEVTEIGKVPSAATPEWQTLSYRDTVVVAGTDVQYRVTSVLGDGTASTSVTSGSLRIPGTSITGVVSDPDGLAIQVNWSAARGTVAGYELRRSGGGSDEVVMATEDVSTRSFVDTSLEGNVTYEYELVSVLEGGSRVRSATKSGGIYVISVSKDLDGAPRHGRTMVANCDRMKLFQTDRWESARLITEDNQIKINESETSANNPPIVIEAQPADLSTVSLSGDTFVAGATPDGDSAFLSRYRPVDGRFIVYFRVEWPVAGATRTGVDEFQDGQVIVFSGTTLRAYDSEEGAFIGEKTLDAEPIDVAYHKGAIWLAYPDRLLKSNPVASLADLTVWESLPLPDITVTSMSYFRDLIVILDGVNAKMHLLDADGVPALSMDAPGNDLTSGSIDGFTNLVPSVVDRICHVDGTGVMYVWGPDGVFPGNS